MSDDGYLFFDETPKQCPGCGNNDRPAIDGPSDLMINWVPLVSNYLCIDCRTRWAVWACRQSPGCLDGSGKPAVVKNLELLEKGEAPSYVKD